MRVVRRPKLLDDIADAYAWIARDNAVAAERLLDRIDSTVATLAAHPYIGAPRERLGLGLRSFAFARSGIFCSIGLRTTI